MFSIAVVLSIRTYLLDEFSLHTPLTDVYRYRIPIVRIHNHQTACYDFEFSLNYLYKKSIGSCSLPPWSAFTWIYFTYDIIIAIWLGMMVITLVLALDYARPRLDISASRCAALDPAGGLYGVFFSCCSSFFLAALALVPATGKESALELDSFLFLEATLRTGVLGRGVEDRR